MAKKKEPIKRMTRELWILRHAKADRNDDIDDIDRPLKKRGKLAAVRLGSWLREQNLLPDIIISSPAKRAFGTANRVHEALGVHDLVILQNKHLYAEGFERIKTVLAECAPEHNRVMIVGHNPELEDLLIHLVGLDNVPNEGKLLPTATLARLVLPDDWSHLEPGCAELISITSAKSLPDNAID